MFNDKNNQTKYKGYMKREHNKTATVKLTVKG